VQNVQVVLSVQLVTPDMDFKALNVISALQQPISAVKIVNLAPAPAQLVPVVQPARPVMLDMACKRVNVTLAPLEPT